MSIEEKPLVRAAFLLCKKVQVFYLSTGFIIRANCSRFPRLHKMCREWVLSIRLYKNLYLCDCA